MKAQSTSQQKKQLFKKYMLTYYRDETVSLGINIQESLNILFICDVSLQAW